MGLSDWGKVNKLGEMGDEMKGFGIINILVFHFNRHWSKFFCLISIVVLVRRRFLYLAYSHDHPFR